MPHCIAETPGTNCDHGLKSLDISSYRKLTYTNRPQAHLFEVLSLATQNVLANIRVEDVFWKTTLSVEKFGLETKNQLRGWWTVRIRLSLGSGGPDSQLCSLKMNRVLNRVPGGQIIFRSSMRYSVCYFLLDMW